MGARRSSATRSTSREHGAGRAIAGLGLVGFIAKGIALVIVGVLLIVASFSSDADTAGGLDGALRALLALAFGPLLVAVVGVGFIAYGSSASSGRGTRGSPRRRRRHPACQPPGVDRRAV